MLAQIVGLNKQPNRAHEMAHYKEMEVRIARLYELTRQVIASNRQALESERAVP